MPALPLAKASYRRGDNVPTRLVNMLFESDPTNTQDQVSLISRFGLDDETFDTVGSGPVRGVLREESDLFAWVVSGTALYKVQSDGTATLIGTGSEIAGTARVRMASNGTDVMIAAGTLASPVLYTSSGSAPTAVSVPDGSGIVDVICVSGVFMLLMKDSQRVYFTEPYATTIDPLNYFSAELTPDRIIALVTNGDQAHLIGSTATEVWVPYSDADLPFQRVEGQLSGGGCAARHSACLVGDAACWVGDNNILYRRGEPFSDNDMTALIAGARAGLSDWTLGGGLNAWSFPFHNHELYVLDIPAAGTFAFDFQSRQWFELQSYGKTLFRIGGAAKMPNGVWIGGDSHDGTIWKIDPELTSDGDDPMVRTFTAFIESTSTVGNGAVGLECTTGQATIGEPDDTPTIQMRISDDKGKTWTGWLDESLGHQGDYDAEPVWRRLGSVRRPGRLYEFRFSDNLPLTVRKAWYNEKPAR